jgi:hypothetical protein
LPSSYPCYPGNISFEKENNTLVVSEISYPEGCNISDILWENFKLYSYYNNSGGATFPKGAIKEGDKITKCYGEFSLAYWPSGARSGIQSVDWHWNFEEQS